MKKVTKPAIYRMEKQYELPSLIVESHLWHLKLQSPLASQHERISPLFVD